MWWTTENLRFGAYDGLPRRICSFAPQALRSVSGGRADDRRRPRRNCGRRAAHEVRTEPVDAAAKAVADRRRRADPVRVAELPRARRAAFQRAGVGEVERLRHRLVPPAPAARRGARAEQHRPGPCQWMPTRSNERGAAAAASTRSPRSGTSRVNSSGSPAASAVEGATRTASTLSSRNFIGRGVESRKRRPSPPGCAPPP